MTNKEVIRYWHNYLEAIGLHLRSDGKRLYSYAMLIGVHYKGKTYVLDIGHSPSRTTSRHINMAAELFGVNIVDELPKE